MASVTSSKQHEEEMMELRRGPWTLEEDNLLMNYIACHGEGRWNLLARCSGLKRTGKSCRLRWLNYLKPDIKRGNLTPEEQLLILELHSKWGNRWSRIAQHLPGRTDNEIKNYWRTRVQKQARQLRVDANSAVFRDAVRCYWMPRLLVKMAAATNPVDHPALFHPESNITATTGMASSPATNAPPGSHGGYGGDNNSNQRSYVVDPSPSTSATSGSGSTSLPPVPCFSELNWVVDQYGVPCYTDVDGSGAGAFDSAALGSLGLDGLDLGPADCDVDYSDSTLLDYLNSTCCTGGGAGAMMTTAMGGGAMGGHGDYGPPSWRTTDELCHKLGDHQWGGGGGI
nr:unnamed protein product [Digitaria exilis]